MSAVLGLLVDRRAQQEDVIYLNQGQTAVGAAVPPAAHSASSALSERVVLRYKMPWAEVVTNFYDHLKSVTAGYASLDWTPCGYEVADIVKVHVLWLLNLCSLQYAECRLICLLIASLLTR
jgi:translation elongation factor EF-4